jgi:hypothetical protein
MQIKYGDKYKNSEKNIKKRYSEKETLEKIKTLIKQCESFDELKENPISVVYGYEALNHELNGYYGFNLYKNGGTIRLIFSINIEENIVILEYVFEKHYMDFKNKL